MTHYHDEDENDMAFIRDTEAEPNMRPTSVPGPALEALDPKALRPGQWSTVPKQMVGERFHRLIVESFAGYNKHKQRMFKCICDCGGIAIVRGNALRAGTTASCGCHQKEVRLRHGKHSTPEYGIWAGMLSRCNNPKLRAYKWYGARGISVCERWRKFENFLADMGERPAASMSIDRYPDNDGNYEPGNCRWATSAEQANNKRQANQFTKTERIHG